MVENKQKKSKCLISHVKYLEINDLKKSNDDKDEKKCCVL